ncbi:MAG: SMP-30/gluconolactonase/LRE family protein [Nitrospinota bacterium]
MRRIERRLTCRVSSRWRFGSFASVFLLLFAGCATVERPGVQELFRPEAPPTARIKFVGLLRDQDDLTGGSGNGFTEALLGEKPRPRTLSVQPMSVASSTDGKRLYVLDFVKRRVSPFGVEKPGNSITNPFGVAVDEGDNVYAVESELKLIRVFDPSGEFLRNIGHESVERPTGIAIDPDRRRIYVADSSKKASKNHVVHVFDMEGTHPKAFGGRGFKEGKFYFPTYLALDNKGNLYVSDPINARVQVFDPEGRHLKTFGERGDGIGMFFRPKGVSLDSFGNLCCGLWLEQRPDLQPAGSGSALLRCAWTLPRPSLQPHGDRDRQEEPNLRGRCVQRPCAHLPVDQHQGGGQPPDPAEPD